MVQQSWPGQRAGKGSYLRMVQTELRKDLEYGTTQLETYMVV